jgi:hypothetical protein
MLSRLEKHLSLTRGAFLYLLLLRDARAYDKLEPMKTLVRKANLKKYPRMKGMTGYEYAKYVAKRLGGKLEQQRLF